MNRKESLKKLYQLLGDARCCAVMAGMDHHFVSEIGHLIATVEANAEE